MSVLQAFGDAYRTVSGQKKEALKFLATEIALTAMCLAPQLFLTDKGSLKILAAAALLAAGLAGVTLVFLWMLVHLSDLTSLGIPYLYPLGLGQLPALRPRLVLEKRRAAVLHPRDIRNQ